MNEDYARALDDVLALLRYEMGRCHHEEWHGYEAAINDVEQLKRAGGAA